MGPYGVLDVVYLPDSDEFVTLSDKTSPSTISKKGEIDRVQEHVKIPFLLKNYSDALLIAVGGGQEVVTALYYGVENITAVEIDAQRVSLMENDFKNYSNNLFFADRVNIVVDSGRAFLRKHDVKFDLINVQRPWTSKTINTHFYDASGELFTEEALDAYLNALEDGGIIYWGLPTRGLHKDSVRLTLKNRIDVLEDSMLVFFPYKDDPTFISILMSKGFNLSYFYSNYKGVYDFVYYPSIPAEESELAQFFSSDVWVRRVDRQFYGLFNVVNLNFYFSIFLLFLVVVFVFSVLVRGRLNFGFFTYLLLGVGYEVVSMFFLIWLSFFFLNFVQLLPIVYVVFFLFGSVGYLHSGLVNKRAVFLVCFMLSCTFLFVWFNNLFFIGDQLELFYLVLIVFLFLLVSYLITFPFGYLIKREKRVHVALSVDYVGSLLSLVLIYFLPNLDYLLFVVVSIYFVVGLLVILKK
jgi:hypothetical protein